MILASEAGQWLFIKDAGELLALNHYRQLIKRFSLHHRNHL